MTRTPVQPGQDPWLTAHTRKAPPALRDRVLAQAAAASGGGQRDERLAEAADRLLSAVEQHPGDRSVALDLLAADALITLALLARAEAAPQDLGEFATALLQTKRAT